MPTEAIEHADVQNLRLHRMEASIEELNARIARLAIALKVSLENENDLAHAMQQLQIQAQPHDLQDTPERRLSSQRMELRGLLILRYGVEKRFVDEVGATATRQVLADAEDHMARLGFQPGADGIDLKRIFANC